MTQKILFNLIFYQFQLSDSGTYVCVATSASGTAEKNYDITVNLPPSIDDFYDDVVAVVGDNVTLQCPSNAVPPPVLSWYRYATEVRSSESKALRLILKTCLD